MPNSSDVVGLALDRWRNNLIDLTRRNPLLSLKANHSTYLDIVQPDLMKVHDHLCTQGKTWLFYLPPEAEKPERKSTTKKEPPAPRFNELRTSETDRSALLRILTNQYRRALTDYRERGLHTLHLAFGTLEWRDEEEEPLRSPLVLLPVKLQRHSLKDPFTLNLVEEEPIINPALAERLKQEFDFRLPGAPDDWDKLDQYLAEVRSAVGGLPGWQVQQTVILTLFSFFKGVIFQDMQENAGRIASHPLVQSLAGVPGLLPRPAPLQENALDDTQNHADVYHILDADGSQRLCLEAAARGDSFVLIGPPGTGKSQTIANLIADQIAHGKKVLFVSEKMAALEVVYKRLCHAGLGEFCLELHSHKANKREVIKELARCYQETVLARSKPGAGDFARLKQRIDYLNRYVRSLHQIREPMHKSVWEALADLPRWQHLPLVPLGLPGVRQAGDQDTRFVLTDFAPSHLDELMQLLKRLQHHWHIRGDRDYPWRGFKADRYSLQLRDEVVSMIDRICSRGDKLRLAAEQYAQKLGVAGSISSLLKLGDLLEKRPAETVSQWLTVPDLLSVIGDFEKCAGAYQRLGQARQPLTERYGTLLWKQPVGSAKKIEQAWQSASALLAPGDEHGTEFLKQQQKLRAWAADSQKRIPGWLTELRTVEKWLVLPLAAGAGSTTSTAPGEGKLDPSIESLRAVVRLAGLCMTDHPADPSWLRDATLLREAQAVIASSRSAFIRYTKNRQYLLQIYSEKLFRLDLPRIAHACAGWYQNWLSIFSWQYRKDRRAIAKCRPSEVVPKSVAHDMQLGAEVQADRTILEADKDRRSKLLGRYEKGLDTDIESAERAARLTREALDLLGELHCEPVPPKCMEALVSGSPPEKIRAAIRRLTESFATWSHLTEDLKAILPMAVLPGIDAPLEERALSSLVNYAKALQAALNQFAAVSDSLLGSGPPADMHAFAADLKQAEELLGWEAAQATDAGRWAGLLGPAFQGVNTDWESLRKALVWTRLVRECLGVMQGSDAKAPAIVNDSLLQAAKGAPPSARELRQALEPYEHALHSLEIRYDPPGPLLDDKPLRHHPPEAVLELLARWRDRAGELSDWVDWRYLPERFQHLGLKTFWDHLDQHEIERNQVVELFLKSFWSGWLDALFQIDPVLSQYRRDEFEEIVAEYRALDQRILSQGAARIMALLDPTQAPSTAHQEIALLMKEAHKKTKHLPLRQLFDTIPALLTQLKPCMLMSPLSVSQFLPADSARLQFDLIVFDEASQILPEDAIGAIYRGKQVVVTGDNQQLPPTTFFQQSAGDGGDEEDAPALFESILDTSLGAGFPQKMLRWHYRSQHEHLIAFSNESYYAGRLVTFPAASVYDSALGVQLQHVADGVYDRGGKRDNPREAQAVATRVLQHFHDTPNKTLGVIAFSYAQMNAIEDEIDRQLRDSPQLEPFFKNDRLEGFFVKNLETVQGDERDVIILSVGYGRDEHGKVELNFGPLNREGGERRLNVAITRARQRLLVVSSIRARDLDLANSGAKGLADLRKYLDYAEHGISALGAQDHGRLPVTALHEDVMSVLKGWGYDCVPFVGCGPFRIDVGVAHPQAPGRFLLGIELDGPMYAQADTARDRDRLRPEVLTRLGWKLHRIGTPDWLYRKEEEITRLRGALPSFVGSRP